MHSDAEAMELDLAQVNWPLCLLELKSALKGLRPGQILEVTVSDPQLLGTMRQVLGSSRDRVLGAAERGSVYVMTVQKG